MRYGNISDRQYLRFTSFLILLIFSIAAIQGGSVRSDFHQDKNQQKTPIDRAQEKGQEQATEKQKTEISKPDIEPAKIPDANSMSPQEKKKLAMSLLEETLAAADQLKPVEYRILVQVEAGLMLVPFDKDRSVSLFKDAIKMIRELLKEKGESTRADTGKYSKERHLLFSALRKIAAVSPDLIDELMLRDSYRDGRTISEERTEEARAVLIAAWEHIEGDPALAARMTQQAFQLGQADWISFLDRLSKRDNEQAERLAFALIDQMRDGSFPPAAMTDFRRFVLAPERSSRLKDHFFQSVALRLRGMLGPDASNEELRSGQGQAYLMRRLAGDDFPRWQQEFDNIISEFLISFRARSLSLAPPSIIRREIDTSTVPAKPGDTQFISDALPRIEAIKDSRERDQRYQRLAVEAALRANPWLAEEIMSRIENEAIRKEATLRVYNPLIRKALEDADWPLAQKYASKVHDPLSQTLIFDRIAGAMLKSDKDKPFAKQVYEKALARLDREQASDRIAKAFLIVAKSLYPIDPAGGVLALNSAVSILNELTKGGELQEESLNGFSIRSWIPNSTPGLSADEVLDLIDMMGDVFRELARRDAGEALTVVASLTHQGLEELAHLAISKGLLEEANKSANKSWEKPAQ